MYFISIYLLNFCFRRYPAQIEHLPAQNILTSNVVLRILYRGTPTNVIAVGDLLTFRLEARGHCKKIIIIIIICFKGVFEFVILLLDYYIKLGKFRNL